MTVSAVVRPLVLASLAMITSACALFPDNHSMAYLEAKEQAVIKDASGQPVGGQEAFPIPQLTQAVESPDAFEVPLPAPYVEEGEAEAVTSLNDYQNGGMNARLDKDGAGSSILRLDGGYASNWSAVADAIAASDLKLSDLNRSTGTYYLEMETLVAAEDRGWWASLWGNDELVVSTYLLKMNRARNGVYLSLLTDADTLADDTLTLDVLKQIKSKLGQ